MKRAVALAIAVLACYWLLLIYQLGAQWSVYEQYNYGWAVPFLCLYLLWQRVKNAECRVQSADSCSALPSPGLSAHLPSSVFYLLLAFCALLYAPTRLLHEANPIWRLTSWLWAIEVIAITLILLQLLPTAPSPSRFTFPVSRYTFPICFFLVAVPWPSLFENELTQSLMRLNAATAVEVLGMLGIPGVQHGNVIEVGTGVVGIDEACSGIRSLQATLMISLFFGELYRLTAVRRVLCVAAGFAFSFLFNVGRTTLLTWVAARKGSAAVANWHDPAGVGILVACFVSLWLFALWLGRGRKEIGAGRTEMRDRKEENSPQPPASPLDAPIVAQASPPASSASVPAGGSALHAPRPVVPLSVVSWSLLAWFVPEEIGTELWFRAHETPARPIAWSIKWPRDKSTFETVELAPAVRAMLKFDQGESARWKEPDGSSWQVFFLRWLPARSLYSRVRVSLTKSHNPEICLRAAGMKMQSELDPITLETSASGPINFRRYIFDADGQPIHVFFSVAEAMEAGGSPGFLRMSHWDRLKAGLAGSRNHGQRSLEIVLWGIADPQAAQAALTRELDRLIEVQK